MSRARRATFKLPDIDQAGETIGPFDMESFTRAILYFEAGTPVGPSGNTLRIIASPDGSTEYILVDLTTYRGFNAIVIDPVPRYLFIFSIAQGPPFFDLTQVYLEGIREVND